MITGGFPEGTPDGREGAWDKRISGVTLIRGRVELTDIPATGGHTCPGAE